MPPIVSVIITTKNSERTLEKCLQSVKNQSYKKIELIVVDNYSTDNTTTIAKKYTNNVFSFGPERSAQRNFGAKKSKGKYLLIHDHDIYFNQNSVKECVSLIEKENYQAIILPEKSIGDGFWTKVKSYERSFYIGNDYIEAARFFNRNMFFDLGGYDETLNGIGDWDLNARIRNNGYKISRVQGILLHDEGKLKWISLSKKKKYYAHDFFGPYAKKHPAYFKKQLNFFVRFPINKILKSGFLHPIMFCAMIVMISLEFFSSKIYLIKDIHNK